MQQNKTMPQLSHYARLQVCRRLVELTLITDPNSRAHRRYWQQFNRMAMRFISEETKCTTR